MEGKSRGLSKMASDKKKRIKIGGETVILRKGEKLVLLVRHPQYEIDEQELLVRASEVKEIDYNSKLTKKGKEQAEEFGKWLKKVREANPGLTLQFISSGYRRAKDMATIAKRESGPGRSIQTMEELGEIPFGWKKSKFIKHEGRGKRTSSGRKHRGRTGTLKTTIQWMREGFENYFRGSSRVMERKRQALGNVYGTVRNSNSDIVLLFSHRATISTMVWDINHRTKRKIDGVAALHIMDFGTRIPQTSITELKVKANGEIRARRVLSFPKTAMQILGKERIVRVLRIRRQRMVPHLSGSGMVTGTIIRPRKVKKAMKAMRVKINDPRTLRRKRIAKRLLSLGRKPRA